MKLIFTILLFFNLIGWSAPGSPDSKSDFTMNTMQEIDTQYTYFKIFNHSHFELISPKTNQEISDGYYYEYEDENNLQLKNEFFEDQLCFTSINNLVELKYSVFIQNLNYLLEEHYYENVVHIQKSFIEDIGYTFFKEENLSLKNIRTLKLNEVREIFSIQLFEKTILPNLKINLIKLIETDNIPNIGYTVAYNYDYFFDLNQEMANNLIVYRSFMYKNNKFENLIDAKNKILFDLWTLTNSTDFFSTFFLFPKEKFSDIIKSEELSSIINYSSTYFKSNKELIHFKFKFKANRNFYINDTTNEQIESQFSKLEYLCKMLNFEPFKII